MSEAEDQGHSGVPRGSSPDGRPLSEEEANAVEKAADTFFGAIADGDPDGLWEAFTEDARAYVLNLAIEQGLDFDVGTAIRDGTARPEDREEYLANLLEGIRHDLRGVDLDNLTYEMAREPETDKIRLSFMVQVGVGPQGGHRIPAGSLLMAREGGIWKVDRLIPRPG